MPHRPTDEDEGLWKHVTRGTHKIRKDEPENHPIKSSPRPKKQKPVILEAPRLPPIKNKTGQTSQTYQLNRRDAERLRKGRIEIEATLDLHGLTQERAWRALLSFITLSVSQEKRCVLVITGKGRLSSPSVIRQKLPEWLQNEQIAPYILKVTSAQPKDGGEGAFYMYLRRKRSDGAGGRT